MSHTQLWSDRTKHPATQYPTTIRREPSPLFKRDEAEPCRTYVDDEPIHGDPSDPMWVHYE